MRWAPWNIGVSQGVTVSSTPGIPSVFLIPDQRKTVLHGKPSTSVLIAQQLGFLHSGTGPRWPL